MAGGGISSPLGGPIGGQTQIINGQQYQQYTPAWYAAQAADKIQSSTVAGQALGAGANAAYTGLTGALSGLTGASAGGAPATGGTTLPPTVGYGGMAPQAGTGTGAGSTGSSSGAAAPGTAGSVPDISASQNAAFARAKDQAGTTARASISSLNDEMAGRGALGSGITNQGLADRVSAATNTLGNVETGQLADQYSAASHQQDLANTNQNVQYQGGITQRGQDISAQNATAALAQQKQLALINALGGLSASTVSGNIY